MLSTWTGIHTFIRVKWSRTLPQGMNVQNSERSKVLELKGGQNVYIFEELKIGGQEHNIYFSSISSPYKARVGSRSFKRPFPSFFSARTLQQPPFQVGGLLPISGGPSAARRRLPRWNGVLAGGVGLEPDGLGDRAGASHPGANKSERSPVGTCVPPSGGSFRHCTVPRTNPVERPGFCLPKVCIVPLILT